LQPCRPRRPWRDGSGQARGSACSISQLDSGVAWSARRRRQPSMAPRPVARAPARVCFRPSVVARAPVDPSFVRSTRFLRSDARSGAPVVPAALALLAAAWLAWLTLGAVTLRATGPARLEIEREAHPVDAPADGVVTRTALRLTARAPRGRGPRATAPRRLPPGPRAWRPRDPPRGP
jgi:hypothetical protein